MATDRKYEWSNVYSSDDSTSVASDINLVAHANAIYKKAKEVYQKPEMVNLFAGADDETDSCTIQSTPCYTDSSIEHLIKLPANVPEREDSVLVVILLSITFFVQMFSREFCMPFFEPASEGLLLRSQTSLSLLPILNMVLCVFLTIPACITINKYGVRICILYSCVSSSLGTSLQCLSIGDSTLILYVSAMFLSSASIVVKPLTTTVSTCCFLTGERNLATGFLTSASMAGAAGGFLVKMFMRPEQLYPPTVNPQNQTNTNEIIALYIWCRYGLPIVDDHSHVRTFTVRLLVGGLYSRFQQALWTAYMVAGVMLALPLSWTTQSLLYELAADFAQPLPENMAVGLICMLEMLCENFMYILLSVFPKFQQYAKRNVQSTKSTARCAKHNEQSVISNAQRAQRDVQSTMSKA
ncbi:hypothetical protein ACI65C_008775 [Semiaphis heraclei]